MINESLFMFLHFFTLTLHFILCFYRMIYCSNVFLFSVFIQEAFIRDVTHFNLIHTSFSPLITPFEPLANHMRLTPLNPCRILFNPLDHFFNFLVFLKPTLSFQSPQGDRFQLLFSTIIKKVTRSQAPIALSLKHDVL